CIDRRRSLGPDRSSPAQQASAFSIHAGFKVRPFLNYGTTAKRRSKFDIVLPHWKFIHPMRTAPLCQEKKPGFSFPATARKPRRAALRRFIAARAARRDNAKRLAEQFDLCFARRRTDRHAQRAKAAAEPHGFQHVAGTDLSGGAGRPG